MMKTIFLSSMILFLLNMPGRKYQNLPSVAGAAAHENTSSPKPEIFSEGIISTDQDEFGSTFTPDGHTIFFGRKSPSGLRSAVVVICSSQLKDGKWQTPEVASFSGVYKDFNPSVSPDGGTLFFISTRPVPGKTQHDTNIWSVKKSGSGWSEPECIEAPVNSEAYELGCSAASDGTLYFSSTLDGKSADLYRSRMVNGKYQEPENLSEAINSPLDEMDPFIAPDQSYILFACTGREDALAADAGAVYPRGDLYISFQQDGKWTPAKNMGASVNSGAEESNPGVSGDGKTLYFTSERNFVTLPLPKSFNYTDLENHLHSAANGLGDIYEVPFESMSKK